MLTFFPKVDKIHSHLFCTVLYWYTNLIKCLIEIRDVFFLMIILLCSCLRLVEDFKEYGDMDMMMQYVKEVQTVQKKLGDCVESIGFINEV